MIGIPDSEPVAALAPLSLTETPKTAELASSGFSVSQFAHC